ncbi:MAG: gliding motility-associated C-terminal domain-containing protein [Bacteroidales bacterium]|jgi:gliding motility-associated-like protein|nr:gliding motility-associated C-terminal domain-containing protein [Bacteroidales bacterium]
MKQFICFIISCLFAFPLLAQYNIPTSGTDTYVSDDCWIYDDGGPSGNYGNHVSGTIIVQTTSVDKYFIIDLSYSMEVPAQSRLRIYNANNGMLIFSNSVASGTIIIPTCTDKLRISFSTDSDNPQAGFSMHLTTCNKVPYTITGLYADNITVDSAYIRWDTVPGVSDYIVVYGPCPLDMSSATWITTTSDSITISRLNTSSALDTCDEVCVTVLTSVDTMESTCRHCYQPPYHQWIQNPCIYHHPSFLSIMPYTDDTLTDYESLEDSLSLSWNRVDSVNDYILQYWHYGQNDTITMFVHREDTITMIVFGEDTIIMTVDENTPIIQVILTESNSIYHCDTIQFKVKTPCDFEDYCDDRDGHDGKHPEAPTQIYINCLCPVPSPNSVTLTAIVKPNGEVTDSLRVQWTESSNDITWSVLYGGVIYTTDTNFFIFPDVIDFVNYDTIYSVMVFCNCHNLPIEDIGLVCKREMAYYDPPCFLPQAAVISNQVVITPSTITIPWSNANDSLIWVVEVSQNGNIISRDTTMAGQITIDSLDAETSYTVRIYCYTNTLAPCSYVVLDYYTLGYCITYDNLSSPSVRTTIGYYNNPYAFVRLMDYGEDSEESRHTVIDTNTSATDPRTNNQLTRVPPGATTSVRLGNWNTMAQAESITYTYFVDTNVFDLLLLRYAIVLQDREDHTASTQPRFTMEILNANNSLIDPVCGKADFVAGENTDEWNSAPDNVRWKDWTTAGFDLTPYHNQKIYVRLTTKDCADSGHYGYAYYTMECGLKRIESIACGELTANTFIAPEGFAYQWYSVNDPNTVLSTARQFNVNGSGTQYYYCIVSSLENPDCKFRIDATAGNRYPIADFDYSYTFSNCEFAVTFNNTSYVSSDPEGTNMIEDHCETVQWFLPDGSTSTDNSFTHTFSSSGDYHVILVAGLAQNSCTDTIDMVVHLENPTGYLTITGDSSICYGESTTLTATMPGECLWNTGDTTHSITITPQTTTLISVSVVDTFGCMNVTERLVVVNPVYNNIDVYDTICDNEYYAPEGTPLTETGIYHLTLISQAGCDSIIWLHLQVNPTYTDTIYDTICQYETYERSDPDNPFNGQTFDSTALYYANFTNQYGCDSVRVLNLMVHPIYRDTIKADIFKGKTFNLYGFNESEEGIYTQTFQTVYGCDSSIVLDLTVDNVLFPNVVTANDDGVNDVFEIHNLLEQNIFTSTELIIYNRYGKMIYYKKNISQYSDFWKPDSGTPTGTYFYRFIGYRHDKTTNITGTVDVLR